MAIAPVEKARGALRTAVILDEEHVLAIVPALGHEVRLAEDHDAW